MPSLGFGFWPWEEHRKQRKQRVQRPRGGNELGAVTVRPGGPDGWSGGRPGPAGGRALGAREASEPESHGLRFSFRGPASGCGVERGLSGAMEMAGNGGGLGWVGEGGLARGGGGRAFAGRTRASPACIPQTRKPGRPSPRGGAPSCIGVRSLPRNPRSRTRPPEEAVVELRRVQLPLPAPRWHRGGTGRAGKSWVGSPGWGVGAR